MIEAVLKVLVIGVISAVIHGLMDRFRGDGGSGWVEWAKRAAFALVSGLVVCRPEDGYWALGYLLIFTVGSVSGWGHPVGRLLGALNDRDFQSWQVGILRENLWLALVARGLMWTLPIGLLFVPTGNAGYLASALAMAVAFPAAILIANKFPADAPGSRWKPFEQARGGVYGFIVGAARAAQELL